jgi:hypothetical protein
MTGCFINGDLEMKKTEIKRLAFLGMATGALMAQTGIGAVESGHSSINLEYVLAKPSCKAHGGCGGLTADRDRNKTMYQDEDEIADPNIPEDTFEENKKV